MDLHRAVSVQRRCGFISKIVDGLRRACDLCTVLHSVIVRPKLDVPRTDFCSRFDPADVAENIHSLEWHLEPSLRNGCRNTYLFRILSKCIHRHKDISFFSIGGGQFHQVPDAIECGYRIAVINVVLDVLVQFAQIQLINELVFFGVGNRVEETR